MTETKAPSDFALLYSGEHHAWWRPDRAGYTTDIRAAGVYALAEARDIANSSGPDKKVEAQQISSIESLLGPCKSGTVGAFVAESLSTVTAALKVSDEALEAVEWGSTYTISGSTRWDDVDVPACPCCENDKRDGHKPDCKLFAAIEAARSRRAQGGT